MSWPSWMAYSGRFTDINGCPSAAGQVQARESSLVRDRRSTIELRRSSLIIWPDALPVSDLVAQRESY